MPIKIPNNLPAVKTLHDENIFVMTHTRASSQDIRPLRIVLLNLMPKKIETETQLSRLLGNTPLQIELELVRMKSHESSNTSQEHLLSFYKTFDEIQDRRFDGMIITGAPVEQMPFEAVDYWQELCQIMEWSKTNVHSTLHICWGAQAGLYYHYGVDKQPLEKKLFGVFPHQVEYERSILFGDSMISLWCPIPGIPLFAGRILKKSRSYASWPPRKRQGSTRCSPSRAGRFSLWVTRNTTRIR